MSRVKSFTAQSRISNCTILPNEVYQLKLSATAFAVYSYLRRLADPETHQCWPSYTHVTGDMQKRASEIVGGFLEDIFGKELKPWQRDGKMEKAPSV